MKRLFLYYFILGVTFTSLIPNDSSGIETQKQHMDNIILASDLATLPAHGPYFPCDDRIIEDRWMVERFVVLFSKHGNNPLITGDQPWEGKSGPLLGGTVLHDSDDGVFKMWYLVFDEHAYDNKLPFSYNVCYAESRDGLAWNKPAHGLFEHQGSAENNIIKLGRNKTQNLDVELNPLQNSGQHKFVAIHNDLGGVFVSFSQDGKSFECSFEQAAVPYHSDTSNNFVYDNVRKRWLMFVRPKAYAGAGLTRVNRRRVAVKESSDLITWTRERTVLVPQEGDPTDFYGMMVFKRGDLLFGFLQLYDAGKSDKVSSELTWSPDGYQWQRLPAGAQKQPLNLGASGDWDAGQVWIVDKPVMMAEEMWFYYGANNSTHNVLGTSAIGLATTKRDRLIGVRSLPDTLGRLLTHPLKVTGNLYVNAEAGGELRVEVCTPVSNDPQAGWTFSDCIPFTGNQLEAPVCWSGKRLSDLMGQVIRLRFQLQDATLFSFDIR